MPSDIVLAPGEVFDCILAVGDRVAVRVGSVLIARLARPFKLRTWEPVDVFGVPVVHPGRHVLGNPNTSPATVTLTRVGQAYGELVKNGGRRGR